MRVAVGLLFVVAFIAGCSTEEPSTSQGPDTVGLDTDTVAESDQDAQNVEGPGEQDVVGIDQRSGDTVALPSDSASVTDSDAMSSGGCSYPLVTLQTGKDSECSGGNTHQWPVGMAASDCHGWSAMDTSGNGHENSANAIGCHPDGSFSFTQYAGNLTCSGSGTVKTFYPDVCQQDIPPVLHTKAINLACCSDPGHPDCLVGVPSVSIPGGAVTLNGQACP